MADGFAQVHQFIADIEKANADAIKKAGNDIGTAGREEMIVLAAELFGADRKFSGSATSKKAKRQAGATFTAFPQKVEIYPTGDPFYIFLKGRGRSNIAPRRRGRHAVRTPYGAFRRVHGGRLAPRPPSILDPAQRKTADRAAKILADTIIIGIKAAG